jgi:hypothetical protein
MEEIVTINRIKKSLAIVAMVAVYQELTIGWGFSPPPPPPPPSPIMGELIHLCTIGGVVGYGAWKMWKK